MIISAATLCVTCTSSIYTTTYLQIEQEFQTTRVYSSLGLSTFVLGIASGPLLTGPLSEYYGRRPIYITSWTLFIIWTVPSALARNIETLIITRFFNGFTGSSFLAVAGGTTGDIFGKDELQKPMVLVTLAPFVGPSIGPLLGGFINYYLYWRWTYYVSLIWAGGILLAIALCVPETFHPVKLRDKARDVRAATGDDRYWAPMERATIPKKSVVTLTLVRPIRLLLLEPMALCLHIYSALLLGILYLFFGALPEIFRAYHGMNLWQSGLTFLGIIMGMVGAAFTSPVWVRIRQHLLQRHNNKATSNRTGEPEHQLPPAMAGSILIPIGLFWFAWTAQPGIHWMVPVAGSSFFGCGFILVFNGIFTFLVEAYMQHAASALAANGFGRAFFAAAFPMIQIPMFDRLSSHWAVTILALLTCLMMPFPWLFYKYGKSLRMKSKFITPEGG